MAYYGEKKGHVVLIDFGFTKKIPDDILNHARDEYENNNFVEILNIFYNEEKLSNIFPGTNTGYRFNEYPELYDWIIPDMKNETVQKKIEIIQKWNAYILYLKEEYKEYEDEVDNTF